MVVEQLNYTIYDNTNGERFITFFLGHYNHRDRSLQYVNAGHNPAVLCWEGEQRSENLGAGTTVLGAFESLPFLELGKRNHLTNFTIHLYTDGLTERFNKAQEPFGDERLVQFVKRKLCIDPHKFHELFLKELEEFGEGSEQTDDITLLSIRFQ